MSDPENDSYVQAHRELSRRLPSPGPASLLKEQQRVMELMRQRARGSSPAALLSRMHMLERENEQLRHGPHGGAAKGYLSNSGEGK